MLMLDGGEVVHVGKEGSAVYAAVCLLLTNQVPAVGKLR